MGLAARIRAAVAFSGYDGQDIAGALNISPTTLARWEGKSQGGKPPGAEELAKLAEVCEVPVWFFENGYKEPDTEPGLERRLRLIEQSLSLMTQTRKEVLAHVEEMDMRLTAAGLESAAENQTSDRTRGKARRRRTS